MSESSVTDTRASEGTASSDQQNQDSAQNLATRPDIQSKTAQVDNIDQDSTQNLVTRPDIQPTTAQVDNIDQQPHRQVDTGPLTVSKESMPPTSQLQESGPLPTGSQIEKTPNQPTAASSGRSYWEIGWTFSLLAIPMLAVVAVLLYLVYSHQLPQQGSHSQCSGLIVDYGAAQLTSVSSWVSTIASYLAGPLMILLSYFVTKILIKDSIRQGDDCLPTPYQFNLLLSLLGAGILPVWSAANYIVRKRQPRVKVSKPLLLCFLTLLGFLLLSLLTQLSDFWLHRSTTTFLYSLTSPQDPATYGRVLSDYCVTYYNNPNQTEQAKTTDLCPGSSTQQGEVWPCSVTCCINQYCPTGWPQGFAVATSQSSNTTVAVTSGLDAADNHDLVLLMPADVPNGISWEAVTVGVETRCKYITQECAVESTPALFQFNCSDGFSNWGQGPQGSLGVNIDDSNAIFDSANPIQFYVAAMLGATGGYLQRNDSNIRTTDSAIRTLLSCTSSVYDIHYSISNNNISVLSHKLSDKRTAQTVQGPLIKTFDVSPYIQQDILSSVYFTQTDNETLRQIEQGWGRVSLAFSSPSFDAQLTTNRSLTQQRIVSCVHRAPLACLVGLACLYVVIAAILALIGVLSCRDNLRSAQVQLGIAGVTAAAFEEKDPARKTRDADELFAEMRSRKTTAVKDKTQAESLGPRKIGFRNIGNSMRREWELGMPDS